MDHLEAQVVEQEIQMELTDLAAAEAALGQTEVEME